MGKIKLNLASGAVVEKPLINAFRANNNSYVVLDNEMNGSMGLPIILVCKLENDRLIKIADQGEWQVVKEYLKNIIAGNQIEFISVNAEIPADDIYYTQLTLPVPSFDALKNAYRVETVATPVNEPIAPVESMSISPEPVSANLDTVAPSTDPVVPVAESTIASAVDVVAPEVNVYNPLEVAQAPTIDLSSQIPAIETPVVPETPIVEPVVQAVEMPSVPVMDPVVHAVDVVAPVEPPMVESVVEQTLVQEDLFKEQKEAFMQACENMFDALVQKFQKELENRK